MDVFSLLSYINKVSLLAFFITVLVVGYQIYILKKEKSKEKTPTIPDFKERNNFNTVTNFTSLPSTLTKKELKAVNYSKLIFLIISLLTIIIVIVVVSLVKKNSSMVSPTISVPKNTLIPVPTNIIPTNIKPTNMVPTDVKPTNIKPTDITPTTEIILAKETTLTHALSPTEVVNKPQVLPETGSWEKGLLIIGVAISTIFFSFLF
ncbi:hypothetical protein CO165_02715 [Candidatus Roizmanbacteria bacterium CG_4_9_14_3_um_filter_33_18]|uniref:Uncharacterized protein n=3 Tax=Candidatus Roizmaniibacteriota TaxID=1752723 RepID=A0A2M7U9F7_9BACT|nr:MAG: hypothetical protein COW97_02710 [Candidatus Roizmanbacteria bacterium CG22_combo_CG10-13_8_21_14_all_34_12]PIZ67860.1 MAG: hypothetical protein COY12_01055 [Candidatus Roizmanbacteria bacterium CG_4_10_14_0_2_um_filter_33_96]PJA55601.1 MAG: hypothetical protein CO165_02715 [Candidatus Roizmanbacteria bacterium CG_4_9_14_3_um_filter_33_18]